MEQNELKVNNPSSSSDDEDEEEVVSSSEDEESLDSESQQISDSDSDQKQKQDPRKPVIPSPQISIKPDLSPSETEESGSDTDSNSPPKKPVIADPNIKPISSKPMEPEQPKKIGSKANSTPPPTKRLAPAPAPESEKDLKKAKTNTNTPDDDSKKQLFQRLWSEDDEIVILKGMIDYKTEKNGESPSGDMGAFHEFIRKLLHVDVSRAQLVDKVRRLKKKYVNNVSREKNGKDRSFSKSHEQKGFELSKLIWGSDSCISGAESKKNQSQKNGNANKGNTASASTSTGLKSSRLDEKEVSMMDVDKNMDISRFVQYGRSDGPVLIEEIMKGGFESLEGSERVEMEAKWKELKKQELELFVKRSDLVKEQAVRVLKDFNLSRT